MKAKQIGYNLTLGTLTIGASAILGFLSFGGMYVLWPILALATATFVLSVAYEGEIYFQNIRSALKKLLKRKHIELTLTNEFLRDHFPDTSREDCPQFFKDYENQLKVLGEFGHKKLDELSRKRKALVEKKLRKMESWFAQQIFTRHLPHQSTNVCNLEIHNWLNEHNPQINALIASRKKRVVGFNLAKIFSIISGLFMMVGSSYLLVGAFAAIPILAAIPFTALPIIVVPLAVVAGAAYSMLIYNAITSMIENDTIRKWFNRIRDDWRKGQYGHSIFMASTTVVLVLLAVALTVCTAGTWWTIAQNAKPIFEWMLKIPTFVMGIINPIVVGLSAIIFNTQNISETQEMIYDVTKPSKKNKPNVFVRFGHAVKKGFAELRAKENWVQIFNPFRIILKITLAPLRVILFIGHLISMGVADDRMPGIPQWVAATLGTTSEIFEDAHYFVDLAGGGHHHHHHSTKDLLKERHGQGHGHSHDNDLPTRFINAVFAPIYLAAAVWDTCASKLNNDGKKQLGFVAAWKKHWGVKEEKSVKPENLFPVSPEWEEEEAAYTAANNKAARSNNATILLELAKLESEQTTSQRNPEFEKQIAQQDRLLFPKMYETSPVNQSAYPADESQRVQFNQ